MQNFEREIKQQPEIIRSILSKHLENDSVINFPDFPVAAKVTLIASGTSKNSCDFAAYFFEQIAKIPAKAEYASEILEKEPVLDENDLVIFVSQSGKSADVVAAFEKVKRTAAKTLAVVNVEDSPLAKGADYQIFMEAGEELAIPATKSFSATVVKLFLLVLRFTQKKGIDIQKLIDEIKALPDAMEFVFSSGVGAQIAKNFDAKIFLGRGLCYFALNESGLKLKEAALVNTTCFPLGEYVHGHMVTLDSKASILAVSFTFEEIHPVNLNLIERIKNNYNPSMMLLTEENFALKSKFLTPLLVVVLHQVIASELAKIKGLNPDKPTGLKKVTE